MDNLNLRLFNKIKKHLEEKNLNFNSEDQKKKIEAFSSDLQFEYDLMSNIKRYLKTYNDYYRIQGEGEIKLRYYQVLALYFTEYYLKYRNSEDFKEFDTNFLAYWMATGSGKTIIMHLNVLQYIEKLNKLRNIDNLQIILTTPGVNLIEQHKREFIPFIEFLNKKYNNKIDLIIDTTSSLLSLFNKSNAYFELLDSSKIQRLILVDEAHIGISSKEEGEFKKLRSELNKRQSFLFEYSATFYNLTSSIREDYEKSIIYDYNYNLFFKDGYGKDYFMKKIEANIDDTPKDNLDECLKILQNKLEAFYSLKTYTNKISLWGNRFPDKPLIAFMGNTVNNIKDEGKNDEVSDISKVLYYFAELSEEEREKFHYVFNEQIKGNLTLTRNKNVEDEILLSYGDGDYWGIINVGNGENFLKQIEHEEIIKKPPISILEEKYLFKNIDSPQSPINVLIGSRKFAEGWNCFRVSVIGLINLGSSKGNKIIQIFGRGVRLKGLNNDGRRHNIEHIEDYNSIIKKSDEESLIKKLETLCILSLKNTYLSTFVKELEKQNQYFYTFMMPVKQNIIRLNDNKVINFEEYSNKLPVFKQKEQEEGFKKIYLMNNYIKYKTKDKEGELHRFRIKLDYRTDKSVEGYNIVGNIKQFIGKYYDYLDLLSIRKILDDAERENKIKVYEVTNGRIEEISLITILNYVDEIKFKSKLLNDIELIQSIIEKAIEDFYKKLKNRINYVINSNNYIFTDKIKQWDGKEGDFISNYFITTNFKTSKEKEEFIKSYIINNKHEDYLREKEIISEIGYEYHIYYPLLLDKSIQDVIISPDALNLGERKFIKDITNYIKKNYADNTKYEFYLMRNIQSLKNIGIFLENEEDSYYPDFILWVKDCENNKVYLNLIDPKGEMGITYRETNELSDKVKIAFREENPTLNILESKLKELGYNVELNSFIILRETSDYCKHEKDINILQDKLLKYNMLRIDWHEEDEQGSVINNLINGKSYLDIMFEKTGIK